MTSRLGVLAGALALAGCGGRPAAGPSTQLVLATGPKGAVFYPLGDALARIYSARIPGVGARAEETAGAVFNMDALESGRADLGFAQGDPAYAAFTQGTPRNPRPHTLLRTIAVLHMSAVQIVARRDGPVRDVTHLRGRRVGMGPAGSGTEVAARIILEAHGLQPSDVEAQYLPFEEASALLVKRRLEAHFVVASFPADAIVAANASVGVRLLSLDRDVMRSIRARHSFYRPTIVPRGTYAGQDGDVHTLGVDNLLLCRAGLDDELVRRLTQVLLESVPELARVHAAAAGIDPEAAPAAPVPLHPGAARFYRERELFR